MNPLPKQSPFWLLLFGLAALGAGIEGLLSDAVAVPSTIGVSGRLAREAQPGGYWLLTVSYLVAGAFFLGLGYRQHREPSAESAPEPPPPVQPRWARILAWIGVVFGAVLVLAGVMAHFTMDPIINLPFVVILGGGGFLIGLPSVGYLVTGRLQ